MDYQLYHIALSPDLDITLEEFADAWNEAAETRDIAYINLSQTRGAQFFDPVLASALLSVPATVASTAIYDLIKGIISHVQEKKGQPQAPRRHIHIEQTKKSDGTEILAIDIDE
jgi:hypothetical protein